MDEVETFSVAVGGKCLLMVRNPEGVKDPVRVKLSVMDEVTV